MESDRSLAGDDLVRRMLAEFRLARFARELAEFRSAAVAVLREE